MDIFEYWQERKKPMSLDAICENLQRLEKALAKHREGQDLFWTIRNQDGAIWPSSNLPGAIQYDTQAGELRIRREDDTWTSLNIG